MPHDQPFAGKVQGRRAGVAGAVIDGMRQMVLVVTEDDLLADAVDHVLHTAGFAVRRMRRGPVEPVLLEERPALVMLDVGEERLADHPVAVSRLRQSSDVALVVLTSSTRLEDRLAGFEAGADDVLPMPYPLAELRWKVATIMRRTDRQPDCLSLGDLRVDSGAHIVERNGVLVDLTALEFALLVALGRHQGTVLSKTQLLMLVWGFDHQDVNLVEVHVSALRRKLEAVGPRVVHTVRGVGYVLRPVGPALPHHGAASEGPAARRSPVMAQRTV